MRQHHHEWILVRHTRSGELEVMHEDIFVETNDFTMIELGRFATEALAIREMEAREHAVNIIPGSQFNFNFEL